MSAMAKTEHKAEIYYYDIGDYLSREDKFRIMGEFGSMERLPFTRITPNEHGDWISVRNDKFGTWIPIGDKDDKENKQTFFVPNYSCGVKTQRDSWCYNSSKALLEKNIRMSIDFYNEQRTLLFEKKIESVKYSDTKFSWTRQALKDVQHNKPFDYDDGNIVISMYRPFFKQNLFFYRPLNEMVYQIEKLFPTHEHKNLVICTSSIGDKNFSAIITDCLPDLHLNATTQCFPLYWYEKIEPGQNSLFGDDGVQYIKHDGVSDFILDRAQTKYGAKVQREDIFYYVYGILHSKSYRETFSADLKKMLPRIPLVSDWGKFWAFSKAGRELARLHLDYENVAPCPDVKVESLPQAVYKMPSPKIDLPELELVAADSVVEPVETTDNKGLPLDDSDYDYYAVAQMKFLKKGEKGTIIYNHYHTLTNIPEKAYEYVVNGKSAIEWIMERYAVTTDKKSGITNNPNDWAREHGKSRYILDMLLSVINVSVQTVDIVDALPEVDWEKE